MKKILGIIIIISILVFLYLYYENNCLQISEYNIIDNKIPDNFNNYKIIQVSDFHNTGSRILTKTLIKELKKNNPNIIVLTGDLIDSKKTNINIAIEFIKEINNIAPIYFINGNHEANISDYSYFKHKLEENKVIILDNRLYILKENKSEINLIGINDPTMKNNPYETDDEIIEFEIDSIDYNKK